MSRDERVDCENDVDENPDPMVPTTRAQAREALGEQR